MPIPILKQGNVLIASVQAITSDDDLRNLQHDLMQMVGEYRSRGVIVDVNGMDVMDSFSTRTLRNLAHGLRLRGAECVIVGIQPEVAWSMIQLGLTLEGVTTALDLEEGLDSLSAWARKRRGSGR